MIAAFSTMFVPVETVTYASAELKRSICLEHPINTAIDVANPSLL
jgi:hypothetical protein